MGKVPPAPLRAYPCLGLRLPCNDKRGCLDGVSRPPPHPNSWHSGPDELVCILGGRLEPTACHSWGGLDSTSKCSEQNQFRALLLILLRVNDFQSLLGWVNDFLTLPSPFQDYNCISSDTFSTGAPSEGQDVANSSSHVLRPPVCLWPAYLLSAAALKFQAWFQHRTIPWSSR